MPGTVRALKWIGVSLAVLFLALVLFVLFGLNALRGPIESLSERITGRELRIEGDLRAVWDWKHPRFRAERVTFADADWARSQTMFRADAVEASISVLPLLAGRVVVPDLHLVRPEVNLEYAPDGRKNWVFDRDPEAQKGESRVFIRSLTLDEGTLAYFQPGMETDLEVRLASRGNGIAFEAAGDYKGMPAKAAGQGGPALALRASDTPYPLQARGRIGRTDVAVDGTLTNVASLESLDLNIALSGATLSHLYDVIGIAFPETSPYKTAGRLVREKDLVRYEDFSGTIGESDVAGTFEVDTSGERPFMRGKLRSKVLNFADLGPLVGTDAPAKGGVLPDSPFDASRWDSVDADVRIEAGTIKRPRQLPLDALSTRIRMKDSVLALDPLEFGIAGGRLLGPIVLDGRKDPIQASAKLRIEKLALNRLFPTIQESQASIGAFSGIIDVRGSGNSVARMLGSSDGKIGVYVDGGSMSAFLAQLMALDLWGLAKVKLSPDNEKVEIRCAIADFTVKEGVARANAIVFDTSVVNIQGNGSVNFGSEALDLTLKPEPKDRSIASLNSPLYVRGTLGKPQVSPDVGRIATKGVGAVILGIINPLLAVLPLLEEGEGKDSPCGQLIAQASKTAKEAKQDKQKAGEAAAAGGSKESRRSPGAKAGKKAD